MLYSMNNSDLGEYRARKATRNSGVDSTQCVIPSVSQAYYDAVGLHYRFIGFSCALLLLLTIQKCANIDL